MKRTAAVIALIVALASPFLPAEGSVAPASSFLQTDVPAITKLVLPCGGWGTRMMPYTKAQPKEVANILNKPAIQLVVEEGIASGLTEFVIVTKRHKDSIADHFDALPELEGSLYRNKKEHLISDITGIRSKADFMYIRQAEQKGTGDAVLITQKWIKDEFFCVAFPDNIFIGEENLFAEMIKIAQRENASVVAVEEVPLKEVVHHGVVVIKKEIEPGLYEIADLVEKPRPEEAPSRLVNCARFVLSSKIFKSLETIPCAPNGELQLPDAILDLIKRGERVLAYWSKNQRYDIGRPMPWLETNIRYALQHPTFKDEMRSLLKTVSDELFNK